MANILFPELSLPVELVRDLERQNPIADPRVITVSLPALLIVR